jgi:hypothetical protein
MKDIPWILVLMLGTRTPLKIFFVGAVGVVQGRKTGRWPTLAEWCIALVIISRRIPQDRHHICNAAEALPNRRRRAA